jgi:hypothetical protein
VVVLAPAEAVLKPTIGPVWATLAREIDLGVCLLGKLPTARQEVGMYMSFSYCNDTKAMICSQSNVAINVSLGVDHNGFAGGLAPNQIGGLSQGIVIYQT